MELALRTQEVAAHDTGSLLQGSMVARPYLAVLELGTHVELQLHVQFARRCDAGNWDRACSVLTFRFQIGCAHCRLPTYNNSAWLPGRLDRCTSPWRPPMTLRF